MIIDLVHCRDDRVDIVLAPSASEHAPVLFQWKDFAELTIKVTGEFNGWRPEELQPDEKVGKNGLIKHLAPGKYRSINLTMDFTISVYVCSLSVSLFICSVNLSLSLSLSVYNSG